jgi:hypothetical protein
MPPHLHIVAIDLASQEQLAENVRLRSHERFTYHTFCCGLTFRTP